MAELKTRPTDESVERFIESIADEGRREDCRVVEGERYVDSGRILTTAGVTAGIDGALHVVERLLGAEAARWTAAEWMEHGAGGAKPGAAAP